MPRLLDSLHSLHVLRRAGMFELTRPVVLARGAMATRSLGPIAGPARMSALRSPEDMAVIDERGTLSYGELDRRTDALAAAFAAAGVAPGDTVGMLCRDHRGTIEAMVAVGKAGARLVLLNTGFAKPQLADTARREQVRLLIADEEFAGLLDAVDDDTIRMLAWTNPDPEPGSEPGAYPTLDEQIAAHLGSSVRAPARQGGLVLLTGGTTGAPKGAPRRVTSPLAAAQFLERVPQRRGDVVHIAAPTFHGTGLSQLIMALALGSTVVVRRRFDALATIQTVASQRATVLVLVPTMLQRILALGGETLDAYDTSSLRIIMSAGAALPAVLGDEATARFGPVIHNFYGCTEVALATVATPDDWSAAAGTVGRPPRGIQVKLYDDEDREVTTPGVSGRIFVSNNLSFDGYSGGGGKPMIGRFMGTGDTGHRDHAGRLFVDGRDDDMIVSGGENVFPQEIESLVRAMPGVADAASVPVADTEFGQRLRMYVVPDGSVAISDEDVKSHVKSQLARFKVPREVVFVDTLPYTSTGKVSRRDLAALENTTAK